MTNKSPVWFGIEPQNIETPKIDQDRKIRNLKLKGNIYSIYIYIHLYTQEHFSTSRVAMQNIQFGMPDCRPSDKHSQFLTCQTIVFLSKIQYFVRIVKICFFFLWNPHVCCLNSPVFLVKTMFWKTSAEVRWRHLLRHESWGNAEQSDPRNQQNDTCGERNYWCNVDTTVIPLWIYDTTTVCS